MTETAIRSKQDVKNMKPRLIKQIVLQYVSDESKLTMDDLCEIHCISRNVFQWLIQRAIIECIVDYPTCLAIRKKSMANQAKHTMHGKSSTSKYYNSLLEKRLVHFKDYFDICYAEEVARDYLSGTDNIQALAKRLKLSSKEASFLIRKGAIYRFNNDDFAAFFTKLTNQYQNSSNLPIVTSKIQKWRSEAEAIVERIDTIEEQLKSFEQTASSADEQEGLLQSLQDSLNSARKELLLKAMSAE